MHEQSYIAHAIEYAAGWTDAENITQLQALAIAAGIYVCLFFSAHCLLFLFTF